MRTWGLLPEEVRALLRQREWDHSSHLRDRLLGVRAFPIRQPLKPPTGVQALQDLSHFHRYVQAWRDWPHASPVIWETRHYRQLNEQRIPVTLELPSIRALLEVLGPDAIARSRHWEVRMAPIVAFEPCLYPVLVRHLSTVEQLSPDDASLMATLLPQLQPGLGQGRYLRALPLRGVDTKFVETYRKLITDLLDVLHAGAITTRGGLLSWLDCSENPKGWLWVRPLCTEAQARLGGVPILQLPLDVLCAHPMPSEQLLVVENIQAGLSLPDLPHTIAVFGGGRNTAWMEADWLNQKRLAYWGDLDTWGLAILGEARGRQPHLTALLMDHETLQQHRQRMVTEPEPFPYEPQHLTPLEYQLFCELRDRVHGGSRLEQERLSPDYVHTCLHRWINGSL
ncbi:DUF3322 domain-containing protein [Candidatus Entotheonella palauensis]|uniref:DUF3322 domain-containing protein n=1 Tax=Candidatus Entotheonella palauensis TaxID=93172 RepID=UPI000B7F78F0|nr:DUF3322 domain-containing protein [Candidatus Entotheonella palauensis]